VALAELLLWLVSALRCYYGNPAAILVFVQAGPAFAATHPPLSAVFQSTAGAYLTGTQGTLLYHPQALSDLFFFYTIGDLTALDALFFASLGLYLYWVLRGVAAGRDVTQATSRAMQHVAMAALCLFVLKMALATVATEIFWVRTHHQFQLLSSKSAGGIYYPIFGMVLIICSKLLARAQPVELGSEAVA